MKINQPITKEQSKDTGMAMVLICLIIAMITKQFNYISLAIILLLIDMIIPSVFYPIAIVWFGLSNFLGSIVSSVLLTVLFYTLVTPIAFIRKMSGADSLKLNQWKQNQTSVFSERNYTYTIQDLEKPF